jgi:hypothetical protein
MHKFDVVDVLEPLPHFLAEARRRLSTKAHKGQFLEMGLQVGWMRRGGASVNESAAGNVAAQKRNARANALLCRVEKLRNSIWNCV